MTVDLVHCNLVDSLCVCSLVPMQAYLLGFYRLQLFILQAIKAWEISLGTRLVCVHVHVCYE